MKIMIDKYLIGIYGHKNHRVRDIDLRKVTLAIFNWPVIGISSDFRVLHLGFIDIIRRF